MFGDAAPAFVRCLSPIARKLSYLCDKPGCGLGRRSNVDYRRCTRGRSVQTGRTRSPGRAAPQPVSPSARPSQPARRSVVTRRRLTGSSTARRRRTSPRSSACSAACCCPRTRSPTWSRSCAPATSTGRCTRPIFDTILDLYGRGEPADPITVAAALTDAGDIARIGGAPYLHTLIASVPTAANASYYARIVSERAVLRRLIEAGTRIVQLGYGTAGGGGRDTDDLVDLAQQAVYDVTERRVSEDFVRLADLLQPTLDEIESGRRARRRDDRRPDRIHRSRPAAQRPAPRSADHRGRPAGSRQVDRGHGLRPARVGPAQPWPARSSRWK